MSGLVVPSKFYGVLAASRPCLFIGPDDSEVARVISEVGCGALIEIGDGARLADVIISYRDAPRLIAEQAGMGRDWLRNQTDAGKVFLQVADLIKDPCGDV